MKRFSLIPNLNAGELSPLMGGRVDVDKFQSGSATLENMTPKLQGPLQRRGGTSYIGPAKTGVFSRIALPRFYFSSDQAYVLELGPLYLRFWTQRGQLLEGPDPYEIEHDYDAVDLFAGGAVLLPSYVQSRDVQFWTRGTKRPKTLSRFGATDWRWEDFEFSGGPFKDENEDAVTMVLSAIVAVGAQTTLLASAPVLLPGHEGSLLELRGTGQGQTLPWTAGEVSILAGHNRRHDGRTYDAVTSGICGTVPPTHTEGDVSDGGIVWGYRHAGRTVVRIDDVAEVGPDAGLAATVTIMTPINTDFAPGVGSPVTTWSWGAWSDVEGWPTCVGLFRERLVLARGREVWLSASGDFGNFAARTGGEILAENAIRATIAQGRADEILWLMGGDVLLIGTEGGISIMREQTAQLPFGPGNVKVIPGPVIGASRIPPLEMPGGNVLYTDRTRTGLRAVQYSADSDSFSAPDVTRLAEHILQPSLLSCSYQAHRDSLILGVRSDGQLAAMTWDSAEGVFAWARHAIAQGEVEDLAVIPYPFEDVPRDDVWMLVRREVGGVDVRYLEVLEPGFFGPERRCGETTRQWRARASAAVKYAIYVDSGLAYDGTRTGELGIPDTVLAAGEEFTFGSGSGSFLAGDVNRSIYHDYVDADGLPARAEALILTFIDATAVTARIIHQFPLAPDAVLAQGDWRMTAGQVSGLNHLEGFEVALLVDGAPYPRRTVTGGAVTIDPPGAVIKVGLPYKHRYVGLPLEVPVPSGTSQGRTKRISRLKLRVAASLGSRAGTREDRLNPVRELYPYREAATPMGQANPLFWGDAELNDVGGFDDNPTVVIEGDDPLPFLLLAIIPEMEVP